MVVKTWLKLRFPHGLSVILNARYIDQEIINIPTEEEEEDPSSSKDDDPNSTQEMCITPEEGFKALKVVI